MPSGDDDARGSHPYTYREHALHQRARGRARGAAAHKHADAQKGQLLNTAPSSSSTPTHTDHHSLHHSAHASHKATRLPRGLFGDACGEGVSRIPVRPQTSQCMHSVPHAIPHHKDISLTASYTTKTHSPSPFSPRHSDSTRVVGREVTQATRKEQRFHHLEPLGAQAGCAVGTGRGAASHLHRACGQHPAGTYILPLPSPRGSQSTT